MIDTYIKNPLRKQKLFNAINEIPCVKRKAEWAVKWINDKRRFWNEVSSIFNCRRCIFFCFFVLFIG